MPLTELLGHERRQLRVKPRQAVAHGQDERQRSLGGAQASQTLGQSVAACHVIAAEVTRAVRDTTTDAGEVHVGDWIGLTADGVLSIDGSIAGASNRLLDILITPEHELVTIIEGEGSSPANTRRITEFLADEHPGITVEVHHGGQPLYPYYFGIE